MNIIATVLSFFGFLGGLLSLKFIFIKHYRLSSSVASLLYYKIKKESTFSFIIEEEAFVNNREPNIFRAIVMLKNFYLYVNKTERLLTAGWTPKETIVDIYFFRWNDNKLMEMMDEIDGDEKNVNIYISGSYDNIHIGKLDCENYSVMLDKHIYENIEKDVVRTLNGDINKTSALLYGGAGNGKTSFIKYISQKYELPIYMFYFTPEQTNINILQTFSRIPNRSIILLEDFDNYFNDRECIMPNTKVNFTFDVILNVLDGVYNQYKENIFFMTVNHIDRVSDALKNRPSRFKHVVEFTNPSVELKTEVFGDSWLASNIGDITLDQVFKIKDYISLNGSISLEKAKEMF